jgi:hypothetical protein
MLQADGSAVAKLSITGVSRFINLSPMYIGGINASVDEEDDEDVQHCSRHNSLSSSWASLAQAAQ